MLDATTLDLERTECSTHEARQLALEELALELHAEVLLLVEQKRQGKYAMAVRLQRIRDDALWKHYGWFRSFEDYAVKVGAAGSHTTARELATLAKQLESLPLLRALFEAGKVDWTKVRDAAPAALEKPEDEAFWVEEVQKSSSDVVRAKADLALGRAPTKRTTIDLPLEDDALWDHFRKLVGERLGRPITKVQSMRLLLVSAIRGESWRDPLENPFGREDCAAGLPPAEPDDGSEHPTACTAREVVVATSEPPSVEPVKGPARARSARIPGPSALLHLHECRKCSQVEIDGSRGPVPLSLGLTATFRSDAFVQDAEGDVSRTIPAKVRRRVYARDRGRCAVPGCGARGFLDNHHEGGWRKVGHDEDHLFLLCAGHHALRHDGWLRIEGTVSTGLRWFNTAGKELVGPRSSTWWPEAPAKPEVGRTACHTRAWAEPSRSHAAGAVRDARLALRSMGLKLAEADALVGVALAQLPASATAGEIAAAAFRAMS